jgi:hypothetical protein
MDRATFKTFAAIGVLLYGSLYYVAVTLAAVHLGHRLAWRVAIVGLGVTYLSYLCHLVGDAAGPDPAVARHFYDDLGEYAVLLTWASIVIGLLAGICLVF